MTKALSAFSRPDLRSTVTPSQLPICCLAPVKALNNVVFPLLGLPTNANVSRIAIACHLRHQHMCRILLANAQFVTTDR